MRKELTESSREFNRLFEGKQIYYIPNQTAWNSILLPIGHKGIMEVKAAQDLQGKPL